MTTGCEHIQESLVALLAGETAAEQEVELHLAHCARCAEAARELARVWALLGREEDRPLPVLRRLRITAALVRASEVPGLGHGSALPVAMHRPRSVEPLRPRRLRVATLAGLAAMVALSVATAYWTFRPTLERENLLAEMAARGELRHVELQLDEHSPIVRVTLDVPKGTELKGRAEDEPIQTVLTELLTTSQARASMRGRAAEALSGTVGMNSKVRAAMVQALLSDPNPSVRLKAAEALMDQVHLPEVQQAFLQVLSSDPNPGLRVRAIDVILAAPGAVQRPEAIDVLRQAATAPGEERYVQIRAAEFLRGL